MKSKDKTDAIKDRLSKILALAKNNPSEGERNSAMEKLQAMLIKHRLEMKDIEQEVEKKEIIELETIGVNGPWARNIATEVARMNFCKYFWRATPIKENHTKIIYVFVGQRHETELTSELVFFLLNQLMNEANRRARETEDRSFKRSFLNGASEQIVKRVYLLIRQQTRASANVSQSTALQVLNQYELAEMDVNKFMEKYGKIRSVETRTDSKSLAGTHAGTEFGKKIPLHISKKVTS